MWSPEGYYSWREVVAELHRTSESVLSAVGQRAILDNDPRSQMASSLPAQSQLVKAGLAKDYAEAGLIIGITTLLLLVRFMELSPPTFASLEGNKVRPDWPLYSHRDQIEYCDFQWPLNQMPEFRVYFEALSKGSFGLRELLDRFAFIDGETGVIANRNGASHYLKYGIGFDDGAISAALETVGRLRGYLVCWDYFPTGEDFRALVDCLAANEGFSDALDFLYGSMSADVPPSASPKVNIGRPRKRDDAAMTYRLIFPSGHEAEGLSWKEAERAVSQRLGRMVTKATIVRGLRDLPQA